MKLTSDHREAMRAVINGADVYSYRTATCLREVWREHPELIDITKPMAAPEDGAARQPYFGAILTAKGIEAIR